MKFVKLGFVINLKYLVKLIGNYYYGGLFYIMMFWIIKYIFGGFILFYLDFMKFGSLVV